MSTHCYVAYGLRIASELWFPELIPVAETPWSPDVAITVDAASDHQDYAVQVVGADEYRFTVPHVAEYHVRDGSSIRVTPAPGADAAAVRVWLLGAAFGALLHQRGQVILHGSAVETARGAVIFAGRSGIGKSTTAAALSRRGYRVLADDVCALTSVDGRTHVPPGLAHVKLWDDAIERLSLQHAPARRVRPEDNKFGLLLNENLELRSVPLHAVYCLGAGTIDRPALHELRSVNKARALTTNVYRLSYARRTGRSAELFTSLIRLTNHTRVVRVVRPKDGYALDDLLDRLEADWSAA